MIERTCRVCGIKTDAGGWEIDGELVAWQDEDICSACVDAEHEQMLKDAARYRYLRNRRISVADLEGGGVFAGKPGRALILGGEDLDRAIDAEMGEEVAEASTLEARLADCLADCIDRPLLSGRDECGDFRSPLDIRLGFFAPDLSKRAAELLEEAGR